MKTSHSTVTTWAKSAGPGQTLQDSEVKQLFAVRRATGTKWMYYGRNGGTTPTRKILGDIQAMDIHAARIQAQKLNLTSHHATTSPTMADCWLAYQDRMSQFRHSTVRSYRGLWEGHIEPIWGGRRLDQISPVELDRWYTRYYQERGVRASSALRVIRLLCNSSRTTLGYTGPIPTQGVKCRTPSPRERFIQPDEMPSLLAAIAREAYPYRQALMLCLTTGQRIQAVSSMKWADLDLKSGIWKVPVDEGNKITHPVYIPLIPAAIAIIKTCPKASPWVLSASGDRPVGNMYTPWTRVKTRANIDDIRIHDLRRTVGSYQASLGTTLEIIQKSLGHKNAASTRIYAKLLLGPVRKSMTAAVKKMGI